MFQARDQTRKAQNLRTVERSLCYWVFHNFPNFSVSRKWQWSSLPAAADAGDLTSLWSPAPALPLEAVLPPLPQLLQNKISQTSGKSWCCLKMGVSKKNGCILCSTHSCGHWEFLVETRLWILPQEDWKLPTSWDFRADPRAVCENRAAAQSKAAAALTLIFLTSERRNRAKEKLIKCFPWFWSRNSYSVCWRHLNQSLLKWSLAIEQGQAKFRFPNTFYPWHG